ncbi:hypothetical protein Hanom_Chr12g01081961 [Helianthus anomalus]
MLIFFKSKLQVLFIMFVPDCSRCPLPLNLTSFVLNISKSDTLCPLSLIQLNCSVKLGIFVI